jgi:cell division protein FtsI (penicillin-binding protein 3)
MINSSSLDKNFRMRLGVCFIAIALLGGSVLFRAAYLMLLPSDRLETAMNRQFRQEPPRMPRRGYILDRNREPIAVSMEVRSLYANPGKVKKPNTLALQLSRIIDAPEAQLRQRLQSDRGFAWLKRQLSEEEQARVERLIEKNPTYGLFLGLAKESKRFYPHQGLAAQLMGFTNVDARGLEGLELQYEKDLAGTVGSKEDGVTLGLSIDKTLQFALEEELARGLKETGAKAASALLMDADTGEILAMASVPTYNPNRPSQVPGENRRSRLVTDTYEPGSTLKPLLVAGALDLGIVDPKTKVFCEYGKLQIGRHWIRESESKDKWGWLTVGEVLQRSSNVGTTKIGFLMSPQQVFDVYKNLGITQRTGIDLPGESAGGMIVPGRWSRILHSNISFGQGLTTTPLQIARAYGALANGGYLVRPRLVRQRFSFEGENLGEVKAAEKVRVLKPETTRAIQTMLSKVATEEGTAPKAAISGFTIIGKTGTSQKPVPGKGYRSGKYVASFAGFVQGVNPRIVGYVMVDEPKFPFYGGEAAAPIFRRIMMAALARFGVSPDPKLMEIQLAKEKLERSLESRTVATAPKVETPADVPTQLEKADEHFLMPDLKGATAREALKLFHQERFQVQVRGGGKVVRQLPASGALLKQGDRVSIWLEREASIP